MLAGDIGARSTTSAPENLEKAAQYVEHTIKKHGYTFMRQEFSVEVSSPREVTESGIKYYFWKFGYPAVMVTDTAFYRYPHYHEPEDTPDKIDYDKLALVVVGLTSVVRDVCML